MEVKSTKITSQNLTVNLGQNQLRSFRWEYPKLCKPMPFF